MSSIRGSYSHLEATTRLKANLFGLVITWVIYNLFSPFLLVHRMSEALSGETATWYIESAPYALFALNSVVAAFSLYRPRIEPPAATKISFTPIKPSSPLTRAYSPVPKGDLPAPSPLSQSTSSPLVSSQLSNRFSTPTRQGQTGGQLTPGSAHRSSPLSSSTAKILNLPRDTTPSRGGLMLDKSVPAGAAAQPGAVAYSSANKDEMEWADNVWKGLRGKSGRGL